MIIRLFSALFFTASVLFSFSSGVTGSTFLKIGIGARPVALGSAYTAVADDANCVFWNPAGLGQTYALGGTFSFLNLFENINYGAGAFIVRLKSLGVLGLGGAFLSASDTRRDENGNENGSFSNYDAMFLVSFGREIYGDNLFAGASVRGIQSKLGDRTARTATLDGGILFVPHPFFRFGVALKNVGPGIVFIDERDLPPTELRTGTAIVLPLDLESFVLKTTLSADLGFSEFSKISSGFGGELTLLPTNLDFAFNGFSIRGGYQPIEKTGDWSGWSFGLGVMMPLGKDNYFSIDAVHYSYGYLGGADRVSFTLDI
ncbi:PorV/PorQ family protein [candidate division WOR-3 bacterium]|nr:PorV/PorQ family protein [candidate division WOR-3 bacterium]